MGEQKKAGKGRDEKAEAEAAGEGRKAKGQRVGYQTSDFAAGLPEVEPNLQGGSNDELAPATGQGGYEGTSGYQSGPLATDLRERGTVKAGKVKSKGKS